MQTLTKLIHQESLTNRYLSDFQLERIIQGSKQRRYHLVNRAVKNGELLRLKRGLYILTDSIKSGHNHPFAYAQALLPNSYVSLQSALSYHRWIPEAVYQTTSIVSNSKTREYLKIESMPMSFHPLAIHKGHFLELVERTTYKSYTFLLAKPIRALMDLVCLNKESWQGLEWFQKSLRIEYDTLKTIILDEINTLKKVYKQKRVQVFLNEFKIALKELKKQ